MDYEKGDRLNFNWYKKGYTPGTVVHMGRYFIIVEWDDGTITKTNKEFLDSKTIRTANDPH